MTASTAPPLILWARKVRRCSCSCHSSGPVLAPLRIDGVPGSTRFVAGGARVQVAAGVPTRGHRGRAAVSSTWADELDIHGAGVPVPAEQVQRSLIVARWACSVDESGVTRPTPDLHRRHVLT